MLLCSSVAKALQSHQRRGVRWLHGAAHRGGGVLADDPGLGKTLQSIAVTEARIRARLATRVLVVAPSHLTKVWKAKVQKWLGKGHALEVMLVGDESAGLRAYSGEARTRDPT